MRIRVLSYRPQHPDLAPGSEVEVTSSVGASMLNSGAAEAIKEQPQRAVSPPAPERAISSEPQTEATVQTSAPAWTLKTKTPAEYVAEHGDTPEDDLSPTVAKNLEIARALLGA